MLPPQPQLLLTGGGGRRTKSRPGKSRKREGRGPSDEVFVVDEEEGKIWDMPDKQGGQQLTVRRLTLGFGFLIRPSLAPDPLSCLILRQPLDPASLGFPL